MRNSITLTIPFAAPVGTRGAVTLQHDGQCGDKARLAIDTGHQIKGSEAVALLTVADMRQLVDGLMDCIQTLERKERADRDLRVPRDWTNTQEQEA